MSSDLQGVILAEGANTVASSEDVTALDFFEGTFDTVRNVEDALSMYIDVDTLILSEVYGLVKGSDTIANVSIPESPDFEEVGEEFVEQVEQSDVVAVFLTSKTFTRCVAPYWDEIGEVVRPGSIWCLSASRNVLREVDTSVLTANSCSVVEYERRGVARIGQEAREQFVGAVRERADGVRTA